MGEMKRPKKKAYPKKPKSPKSKTMSSLQRYRDRLQEWSKKCDAIDREFEAEMKKYNSFKKSKDSVLAGIGKLAKRKR